jgi:hypothetical protein
MKFATRTVLALLLLVLAVPVMANGSKDGCKVTGSWHGYDGGGNIWWTSTVDGQSASHGTTNLEIPGAVMLFPGAAVMTEMKGQWKKTSGNTYDWTVVGFPLDEFAAPMLIAKVSGTNVFYDDCDMMWVTDIVMEVFPPFANIYSDPPMAVDTSFLDHPGFRIKVDLPELLP